jgi:isopenicillin-N N-acyltransferase like protein
MLHIDCSGTPYEIGHQHGTAARGKIHGSIAFYSSFFVETSALDWPRVELTAQTFIPALQSKWPRYLEEMKGVADGADLDIKSIVALNVRTEIAFGLFKEEEEEGVEGTWVGNGKANGENGYGNGSTSQWLQDGCTSLAWKTKDASWLAQNWDWREEQKANLIALSIAQADMPTIKMVTEAGIIGKIGFNSEGVGVCLNAIRAAGMDSNRLPVHLGLRMVLESISKEKAEEMLRDVGIASACNMVIADETGGMSLECSALGFQKIKTDGKGRVFHSNHYLKEPDKGVVDTVSPRDTLDRIERIEILADKMGEEPTMERLTDAFKDEKGFPASICRAKSGKKSIGATLFNIVMELKGRRAKIVVGRPVQPEETLWLEFS